MLGLATYGKTGKVLLVCSDGGGIYLILKNGKMEKISAGIDELDI